MICSDSCKMGNDFQLYNESRPHHANMCFCMPNPQIIATPASVSHTLQLVLFVFWWFVACTNKWHDKKYMNLWRGKEHLCQYLYEKQNAYQLIKGLRKVAVAFQISEALRVVPLSETLHQSYIAWTIKWLRTWKKQMTTEADILTPIRYNALRTPQQHKEHIEHYCESAWWGKRNRSEFKHRRTNIALPWTRALPRMFESVDNKVNLMKCLSKIVWLSLSNYTQ